MAIKVETDRIVRVAYRLTDNEGRLIEERTPENPFEFVQGQGQVVAPIERAVQGKTAGFRAEITVSPREAYGDYDPSLVVEVPREHFPKGSPIQVGMKFNTVNQQGKPLVVRVIEFDDQSVTIDGNHPLAGLDLIFELRILDVREPGEESPGGGAPGRAPGGASGRGTLH